MKSGKHPITASNFIMKRLLLTLTAFILVLTLAGAGWYLSKYNPAAKSSRTAVTHKSNKVLLRLKTKAAEIVSFAKRNGYNTEVCFMADMNIASGRDRFFIYNPLNDSVLYTGLVTHGRCNENWLTGRKYGNKVGCGCTSLGKYKIGAAYRGRFGLAYKLHGLDSTNNNAFKRYVVLHSHECVPEQEQDPYPICQSDGCPTVSPGFLKILSGIIDASKKPVLLCIYDE